MEGKGIDSKKWSKGLESRVECQARGLEGKNKRMEVGGVRRKEGGSVRLDGSRERVRITG